MKLIPTIIVYIVIDFLGYFFIDRIGFKPTSSKIIYVITMILFQLFILFGGFDK